MTGWVTVLISILGSSAVALAVSQWTDRRQAVWTAKRDACMEAMTVVDGIFANTTWTEDGAEIVPTPQDPPSIADVRRIHNLLAVTCRNREVVEAYDRCLRDEKMADVLDDLRDAIRRECGWRWRKLDRDRSRSFHATVTGTSPSE